MDGLLCAVCCILLFERSKNPFLLTDLTHHSWAAFQILTSHGLNVFKRYLDATRSKRLMALFTLRAETHTIMDQLWSVAHLSSLFYPSIPPCHSGWQCCSIGAHGTPLSLLKGHTLYQLFFSGFPLEGLLYFHLESGCKQQQLQGSFPVDHTAWCYLSMEMSCLFFLFPTETTSTVSNVSLDPS